MYFGCYHWAIPALLPEGIFCWFFFFFSFFCFCFKKGWEWLCTWRNCRWEWRDLRDKTTTKDGRARNKSHSALWFMKGAELSVQLEQLWVEAEDLGVRSIGKGRALGLSPSDWARDGLSQRGKRERDCAGQGGRAVWWNTVSREVVNLEPTVPPELEKGSPSRFPSSRTANAMNHVKTWHPIEMIGLRHFKAVLIYGKQVLNN